MKGAVAPSENRSRLGPRFRLVMHHPYDDLAKKVGQGALSASGSTAIEHAIPRSTQRADIRHDPDPRRAAERARLGLLGRIAEILCLIEVYGHAPDGGEWRGCLTKHFTHWEASRRRARAANRRHKAKGLDPEPFAEPMLWIVAVAFSEPMLRKLKVRTRPSFPPGVFFHGDDLHRVGIVVASQLPRDRSTLLVRFMAAGPLLPEAISDLAALPEDAIERGLVEGELLDLGRVLGAKPRRTPQEEEIVAMVQGTFTVARKLGRDEGRAEGAARSLLAVLRARGLSVTEPLRARILEQTDPERLERWIERAVAAASVDEILDEPLQAR
jgi:hypothetical protein